MMRTLLIILLLSPVLLQAQGIKHYPTCDGIVGESIYFNDTLLTRGLKERRKAQV